MSINSTLPSWHEDTGFKVKIGKLGSESRREIAPTETDVVDAGDHDEERLIREEAARFAQEEAKREEAKRVAQEGPKRLSSDEEWELSTDEERMRAEQEVERREFAHPSYKNVMKQQWWLKSANTLKSGLPPRPPIGQNAPVKSLSRPSYGLPQGPKPGRRTDTPLPPKSLSGPLPSEMTDKDYGNFYYRGRGGASRKMRRSRKMRKSRKMRRVKTQMRRKNSSRKSTRRRTRK